MGVSGRKINPMHNTRPTALSCRNNGPFFRHALALGGYTMLNSENLGFCNFGKYHYGQYDVPADRQGGSPLTGSSFIDAASRYCRFTCTELEVYALE